MPPPEEEETGVLVVSSSVGGGAEGGGPGGMELLSGVSKSSALGSIVDIILGYTTTKEISK